MKMKNITNHKNVNDKHINMIIYWVGNGQGQLAALAKYFTGWTIAHPDIVLLTSLDAKLYSTKTSLLVCVV